MFKEKVVSNWHFSSYAWTNAFWFECVLWNMFYRMVWVLAKNVCLQWSVLNVGTSKLPIFLNVTIFQEWLAPQIDILCYSFFCKRKSLKPNDLENVCMHIEVSTFLFDSVTKTNYFCFQTFTLQEVDAIRVKLSWSVWTHVTSKLEWNFQTRTISNREQSFSCLTVR